MEIGLNLTNEKNWRQSELNYCPWKYENKLKTVMDICFISSACDIAPFVVEQRRLFKKIMKIMTSDN